VQVEKDRFEKIIDLLALEVEVEPADETSKHEGVVAAAAAGVKKGAKKGATVDVSKDFLNALSTLSMFKEFHSGQVYVYIYMYLCTYIYICI